MLPLAVLAATMCLHLLCSCQKSVWWWIILLRGSVPWMLMTNKMTNNPFNDVSVGVCIWGRIIFVACKLQTQNTTFRVPYSGQGIMKPVHCKKELQALPLLILPYWSWRTQWDSGTPSAHMDLNFTKAVTIQREQPISLCHSWARKVIMLRKVITYPHWMMKPPRWAWCITRAIGVGAHCLL